MKWIKAATYTFLGILWLALIFSTAVMADTINQDNVNGSNSQIDNMTSTTTFQDGSSSNTTSNSTNTSNIKSAPYSANAPSLNSMNTCGMAISGSIQTFGVGVATGKHYIDPVCQKINLSKALYGMGMKVASISLLCQIPDVFQAMSAYAANTPCPISGQIGKNATALLFDKYNGKMPTYEQYLKHELKIIKETKLVKKKSYKKSTIIHNDEKN